jgi:hypothetical protein
MIREREGSVKFISMGPRHGSIRGQPYALVAKLLTRGERSMLTERQSRSERRARRRSET